MDNNKIGVFIAALRKSKGMTQSQLAKLLNVSNKTVSKWECGDGYPDITIVPKIAEIFSVTSDEILQGKYNDSAAVPVETKKVRNKNRIAGKILKAAFFTLSGLPLIVTIIVLPFFPDLIPAHYDGSGTVTRWGSKFENFMFPAMIIAIAALIWILMSFLLKQYKKQDIKGIHAEAFEIILLVIFVCCQIAFNALHYWLLARAYNISTAEYGLPAINSFQVGFLAVGLFLTVIGAILPFTPKNPFFGIRTNTAMRNNETWRVSHFWGGITFVILGVTAIIFGFIFDGFIFEEWITGLCIAGILILLIIPIIIQQIIIGKKFYSKDSE